MYYESASRGRLPRHNGEGSHDPVDPFEWPKINALRIALPRLEMTNVGFAGIRPSSQKFSSFFLDKQRFKAYYKNMQTKENPFKEGTEQYQTWESLECNECRSAMTDSMYPSHKGSTWCESGSIASGGHRAHCTCDTCF